MRVKLNVYEISQQVKIAQNFMNTKYPKGVKREVLKNKSDFYDMYFKKHSTEFNRIQKNKKAQEGFAASWVLRLTDKEFITPNDINDPQVVKEYIQHYNIEL